jgi:hypothetical protein
VRDNWILNLDTWFNCDLILEDEKVPFTKLNLTGIAKLLVAECVENQNSITTWTRLMESLCLAFYPSSYNYNMNIKWLHLHKGFNMLVQEYIH